VAYLNGSKVLTTGSALTFDGTNLATTGYLNVADNSFTGSGLGGGAAAAVRYLQGAAGYVSAFVNNSEQMRLTSTGLGLGTSSPTQRLDVAGQITIASGNGYLWGNGTVQIYSNSSYLRFRTASTDRLEIDSSGNLGVGFTPSPTGSNARALQLTNYGTLSGNGNTGNMSMAANAYESADNSWNRVNATSAGMYQVGYTGIHSWYNTGASTGGSAIAWTQAMTLDASSNLMVGTTTTIGKLTVQQSTDGTVGGIAILSADASGGAVISRLNDGGLTFRNGGTERARITSGGDLLVGTTSTSAGARLYVVGSGASGAAARLYNPDLTDSNFTLYVDKPSTTTTTSQVFIGFTVNAQGTGSGQINANGASQAAFGSFSDARLKENIVDLTPQLSNLMALRPVEFDYKDGSGHQTGFVAQEMQQVYPDAIGEQNGFLTVSGYGKTEARLIKAIQEQQAIIEQLKARLDAANL
jgi:hypothetical protein